jgi:hypothetical protein
MFNHTISAKQIDLISLLHNMYFKGYINKLFAITIAVTVNFLAISDKTVSMAV